MIFNKKTLKLKSKITRHAKAVNSDRKRIYELNKENKGKGLITMNKSKIRLIIYGVILLSSILLFKFGRSIWVPVYLKICGRKTVMDVYENIGNKIDNIWDSRYKELGLKSISKKFCIIGLKKEQILEIWTDDLDKNILIKKYKFTAFSGELGPKLQSGDRQIPEGIYEVESLNPNSSYHLSMKINYPNQFDEECAKIDNRKDLGGDIFIHGKNVTIGCIPIGDKNIEELFILVFKVGLKNTKVILAPNDFRKEKVLHSNKTIKWLDKKYSLIKDELNKFQ